MHIGLATYEHPQTGAFVPLPDALVEVFTISGSLYSSARTNGEGEAQVSCPTNSIFFFAVSTDNGVVSVQRGNEPTAAEATYGNCPSSVSLVADSEMGYAYVEMDALIQRSRQLFQQQRNKGRVKVHTGDDTFYSRFYDKIYIAEELLDGYGWSDSF